MWWDTSPFTVTVTATWCATILAVLDLWLLHIDMHWPGTSWDRFKTSHLAVWPSLDSHFVSCVRWPWRFLGCHNWCCIGWTTGRSCDVVGYMLDMFMCLTIGASNADVRQEKQLQLRTWPWQAQVTALNWSVAFSIVHNMFNMLSILTRLPLHSVLDLQGSDITFPSVLGQGLDSQICDFFRDRQCNTLPTSNSIMSTLDQ